MLRFFVLGLLVALGALTTLAAAICGPGWWVLLAVVVVLLLVGAYDVRQRRHSILRNYPVLGHLQFLMEDIRPELQQYFIERNWDGRPYDRDTRSSIYQRAKNVKEEQPFGTERDVDRPGYEYLVHSTRSVDPPDAIFTTDTGMSTVWLSRFVRMTGGRRLIGSYNLGSMANAMPQALGAQALDRSRQVVRSAGTAGCRCSWAT